MKTLWTCSYGRAAKPPKDWPRIAISVGTPNFAKGFGYASALAPDFRKLGFHRIGDQKHRWREHYERQMATMLANGALARAVEALPENAVLFCWDGSPADCHRGILSRVLNEHGLARVREYRAEDEIATYRDQERLFPT